MTTEQDMGSGVAPAPAPDVGAPPPKPAGDERLAHISTMARIMRRPEIGAALAAVVVAEHAFKAAGRIRSGARAAEAEERAAWDE